MFGRVLNRPLYRVEGGEITGTKHTVAKQKILENQKTTFFEDLLFSNIRLKIQMQV